MVNCQSASPPNLEQQDHPLSFTEVQGSKCDESKQYQMTSRQMISVTDMAVRDRLQAKPAREQVEGTFLPIASMKPLMPMHAPKPTVPTSLPMYFMVSNSAKHGTTCTTRPCNQQLHGGFNTDLSVLHGPQSCTKLLAKTPPQVSSSAWRTNIVEDYNILETVPRII